MNKIVIIDTNFLLVPYQFGIDIFRQVDELIPNVHMVIASSIVDELENLSKKKSKTGNAAKLAMKLLAMQKIEIVGTELPADKWIFTYAKMHRAIVCTNDRRLRQKIKRMRLKCIVLRGKDRIGLE